MNKKVLGIILILISVYFIFFRNKEKLTNCSQNNFDIASNPLVKNMNQKLLTNKLSSRSISRIVNFDSRDFNEDRSLTLKQLFDNDKLPKNIQDYLVKEINNLVNSYRLEDITKDYVIEFDTKIASIKHIFLKNMVINTLLCLPEKPDDIPLFWGHLVDMLVTPSGIKCNDEDFLKYFHLNTKNIESFFGNIGGGDFEFNINESTVLPSDGLTLKDKETDIDLNFYNELDKIKLNKEENGIFIISFSKHFMNFGPEILMGKFKKELDKLFDIFTKNNNRSINHESEEDMKRLIDIYEEEFKSLVALIKKSNNDPRLEKQFDNFKNLYPYIKHNLLLTRVQTYLKSKKAPERAFRCLSTNNKICVNDITKIFGNDEIGFVSKSTCVDKDTNKFQNSSLDSIFKIHQFWTKISTDDKKTIFNILRIMLQYHKVIVPENYGVIKLKELKISMEDQSSLWKGETIKQNDNKIYIQLKNLPSVVNNLVSNKEQVQNLLITVISKMNYSQKLVWNRMLRKPDFKLSSSLIKFFVYGLELEKLFKINAVEMLMNMGLPTSKSFNDIMMEYKVPLKYIDFIWKILGSYINPLLVTDINMSISSVFYDDEFFEKSSYYVSYLASICYNKEEVIKRIENNFGENLSIENYEKINKFITQQCKHNK